MHSNSSSHPSVNEDDTRRRTRKRIRKQISDTSPRDHQFNGSSQIEEDKYGDTTATRKRKKRISRTGYDMHEGYMSDEGSSHHTPMKESSHHADPEGANGNRSSGSNTEKRLKAKIRKIDQEEVSLCHFRPSTHTL